VCPRLEEEEDELDMAQMQSRSKRLCIPCKIRL
jgi:hypothetical protein